MFLNAPSTPARISSRNLSLAGKPSEELLSHQATAPSPMPNFPIETDQPDSRSKPIKFPSNFVSLVFNQTHSAEREHQEPNSTICYQKFHFNNVDNSSFGQTLLDVLIEAERESLDNTDFSDNLRAYSKDKKGPSNIRQEKLEKKIAELVLQNDALLKKLSEAEKREKHSSSKLQLVLNENHELKKEILKLKSFTMPDLSALELTYKYQSRNGLESQNIMEAIQANLNSMPIDLNFEPRRASFIKNNGSTSTRHVITGNDAHQTTPRGTINSTNVQVPYEKKETRESYVGRTTNNDLQSIEQELNTLKTRPSVRVTAPRPMEVDGSKRSVCTNFTINEPDKANNLLTNRRYTELPAQISPNSYANVPGRITEQTCNIRPEIKHNYLSNQKNYISARHLPTVQEILPSDMLSFERNQRQSVRQILTPPQQYIKMNTFTCAPNSTTTTSQRCLPMIPENQSIRCIPSQKTITSYSQHELNHGTQKLLYSTRSYVTKKSPNG